MTNPTVRYYHRRCRLRLSRHQTHLHYRAALVCCGLALAACEAVSNGVELPSCESERGNFCRATCLDEYSQVQTSDAPMLALSTTVATEVDEVFQQFSVSVNDTVVWAWSRRTVGGVVSVEPNTAFDLDFRTRGLADHELSISRGGRLLYWAVQATKAPPDNVWVWGGGGVRVEWMPFSNTVCTSTALPDSDVRDHQFRFVIESAEFVVVEGGHVQLDETILSTATVAATAEGEVSDGAVFLFEIVAREWK